MNNRIFSSSEITYITTNINMIEKRLGHPIPGGAVNYDELSRKVLTSSEVGNICHNINMVAKRQGRSYSAYNSENDSPLAVLIGLVVIIIAFIATYFD